MAFVAAATDARFIVDRRPRPAVTARRIARADWRWDGAGHRDRGTRSGGSGGERGQAPPR